MSSSKRGRKRNDNLPPNRARDVQRAFRARRAAHLQALEQRVAELEEENGHLRQALHLPPANRPPLGRGPTGKDKPQGAETASAGSPFSSSRESSSMAESPSSRKSPDSPHHPIPVSMSPSQPMTVLEGSWDDSILLPDNSQPTHTSPMLLNDTHQYPVTAMPNQTPMKAMPHYPTYTNAIAGPSRQLNEGYGDRHHQAYTHSSDRGSTTGYAQHPYAPRAQDVGHPAYMQISSSSPNPFHHSSTPHSAQDTARPLHHPQPTPGHITFLQERDHRRDSPSHFPTHRASLPNIHAYSDYSRGTGYLGAPFHSGGRPLQMDSQSRSSLTHYMPRVASDAGLSVASNTRSPFATDGRTLPMS